VTEQQTKPSGDEPEPARRQTPTERYHELAMLVAARQPTVPEHALELTRNAKGDVQIALTVRSGDLDVLEANATAAFDRLCAKYQRADVVPAAGDGAANG
jgi:hypothetical protein